MLAHAGGLSWSGRFALGLALAVAGCGGGGAGGDGGGLVGGRPTCAQLDQQITEAIAVPGSCQTDADCTYIGGQLSGTQTCNCAPYIIDCGGRGIERDAPGLARAQQLIDQFKAEGCPSASACDCGINGPLRCAPDHHCTAPLRSCLVPPIDAGPDAPDATP